jgi:hypothetical protein
MAQMVDLRRRPAMDSLQLKIQEMTQEGERHSR